MTTHSVNGALVSIVIPVFNGANYLAQAIDSALAQTYPNCEVIVVNDGSEDGGQTEHIAHGYGSRIRYFSQANGGVATALNHGLSVMQGRFFSWLSHDDLYDPQKIKRQLACMAQAPGEDLIVYSDYRIFSDDGREADIQLQETSAEGFRWRLALYSNINGCTLLIPAHLLRAAGGFDPTLRTTQDYELWFRLAKDHRFVHLPMVLVASRSHQQQGIFTQSTRALRECQALHAKFAKELREVDLPSATTEGRSRLYAKMARIYTARGFVDAARIARARARSNGAGRGALLLAQSLGRMQCTLAQWARRTIAPTLRSTLRQSAARIGLWR